MYFEIVFMSNVYILYVKIGLGHIITLWSITCTTSKKIGISVNSSMALKILIDVITWISRINSRNRSRMYSKRVKMSRNH